LRSLLKERQREGIAVAKAAGIGRNRALTPQRVTELRDRIKAGEKKAANAGDLGISRETFTATCNLTGMLSMNSLACSQQMTFGYLGVLWRKDRPAVAHTSIFKHEHSIRPGNSWLFEGETVLA
jgi:hypothetical protein